MTIFDRNFLITTGVTAVICGAIYYYLNTKIRDLEMALVKQNQVLSSFIANVQQEFRTMASANAIGANGGGGANMYAMSFGTNELASDEAIAAVKEFEHKKIVISDSEGDSASEADDESESESESECDSEADDNESASESDDNKLVICDLSPNDTTNNMKIIDMSSLGITNLYSPEIYTPEKTSENGSDSDSESESESGSEEDGFHRVTKLTLANVLDVSSKISGLEEIKLTEVKLDTLEEVKLDTLEDFSSTLLTIPIPVDVPANVPANVLAPTAKYDDLKVDDLRKLVLEKGLVQKDEVKKLKKNELLAVLKKHTF